jgi:hypothetical protein
MEEMNCNFASFLEISSLPLWMDKFLVRCSNSGKRR